MTTRPRILFISDLDVWSLGPNKGGPALNQTLRAYAQANWDVTFITSNASTASQNFPGITTLRFDLPWLKKFQGIRRIGSIAKLLFWVYFQLRAVQIACRCNSEGPFSIVYGYEITAIPAAKWLSWLWGVPLVARFQGTIFTRHDGRWLDRIRIWDHWLALKIPADLVIMTNDGTRGDRVLRKLGVDMSRVRFWMNGTDRDDSSSPLSHDEARQQLNLTGEPLLLTVSRLVGWKRVDRAIQAIPEIRRHFPNVRLVVVGDGEERDRLLALASSLGVADCLSLVGAVPHDQVRRYLAAADFFLSLYSLSNLGNPLLEAMLAGKCIITLDNGDTGTLIHDGVNGILLPETDVSRLPETIVNLWKAPAFRQELETQAKASALHEFQTWKQRMSQEFEALQQAIALRRHRSALRVAQHPAAGRIR